MEREELHLGENLTREKVWESDGIAVLRADVELPQLAGSSHRVRRFNRYYRRLANAYFVYCEQMLLPYAKEQCKTALKNSAPWSHTQAQMRFTVTCRADSIFSLYIDAKETDGPVPRLTLRRADTWDLKSMLPIPLSEHYPPHAHCRRQLIRFARETAQRQQEQGSAVYDRNWRTLLRTAFSTRNYYLSDAGLCFFYPMYALAPAAEGIVTFTVPYHAESGPFPPLRAAAEETGHPQRRKVLRSDPPAVEQIGIDRRNDHHHKKDGKKHIEIPPFENAQHNECHTAEHP